MNPGTESFDTAVTRFRAFLVPQNYPPNLLWLKPDDIMFWCLRYFFWKGDSSERASHARIEYDKAVVRNLGIEFQAQCKTARWTICRVYVPKDDVDAEYRMIPKAGAKLSAANDPKPATEIDSPIQWRIPKWLVRKGRPCWD
jgi:hypothetical protein